MKLKKINMKFRKTKQTKKEMALSLLAKQRRQLPDKLYNLSFFECLELAYELNDELETSIKRDIEKYGYEECRHFLIRPMTVRDFAELVDLNFNKNPLWERVTNYDKLIVVEKLMHLQKITP